MYPYGFVLYIITLGYDGSRFLSRLINIISSLYACLARLTLTVYVYLSADRGADPSYAILMHTSRVAIIAN